MSEKNNLLKLNALIDYFSSRGNFDHPDMDEVARMGEQFGLSKFDASKAFFIAREKASLTESESLDGGNGSESKRVSNYGLNSVHEMLFENTGQKSR